MIRINSVSAGGNEELANFVSLLLQDRGIKTQLQQVMHSLDGVSKRQFNLIGILGDPLVDRKTRKGLLLQTHLDTVSPGLPENWTETGGDPFSTTIKDGKIFGLGAADAKIDFLCKAAAVEKFIERKLKQPVYLVGTCGEELGMLGTKYLIKSVALNPKYVLVSEPSDLQLVYGHKAMAIFRVSIDFNVVERDARGFDRRIDLHSYGRSASAAAPGSGINALHQILDFLRHAVAAGFEFRFKRIEGGDSASKVPDRGFAEFYLSSHQFEDFKRFFRERVRLENRERSFRVELGGLGDMGIRFLPDELFHCVSDCAVYFRSLADQFASTSDESFDPPTSTASFGAIKQRRAGMDLFFDLRLLPESSLEVFEKTILQGIQGIASKYPSLNIALHREGHNPGLSMNQNSDFVKVCRDAMTASSVPQKLVKRSTSTEAAQFFQAGYEALAFGPGPAVGNSRSPNEHNLLEHLEKATAFYIKLIEKVCL